MPAPPLESLPAMVRTVVRLGHRVTCARRGFAEHQQELELGAARASISSRPAARRRPDDDCFGSTRSSVGRSGAAVARRQVDDAEAAVGLERACDVLQEDGDPRTTGPRRIAIS